MHSTTGFAPVNGAQLYYEMAGDGTPLLLLHAGVADSRMWDEQFTVLAEKYRVIRFDYRGFGQSQMPAGEFCNYEDVAGLLDFLAAPQAIVVGISFGGLIAIDFTLAYPERVLKLVLAAPSVSGATPSDRIKQFWQAEDEAFERGDLDEAVEVNLRAWVDGIYRQPHEVNTAVRQIVGLMQREIFEMDTPDDIDEIDLEPPAHGRVQTITTPTLILIGSLDLPEKVEQASWLAEQLPNAQLVTIPDAAHLLNMEAPEPFNQHVLHFLEKETDTHSR